MEAFYRPFTVGYSSVLELNSLTVFVSSKKAFSMSRYRSDKKPGPFVLVHVQFDVLTSRGPCASSGPSQSKIVSSGSTRAFLLTSFAGQDQRLTSCFKLLLLLY